MIKRYNNYQNAKFPWVSEIPNHWKEGKVKYLFDIGRGRVISKQELKVDGLFPVYSSQTKNDGCLGYIETYDFEGDLLTWTTDGVNAGQVFRRSGKFNCTNVCGTLKAKRDNLDLRFYLYLLQFLTPFYKRPDTNGAKIMNGEMAEIHTFNPPSEEQTKIAEYLDHQTGLIDKIIEKKQRLIEKFKEQRQAVINEAVTKGLDRNARRKDSGVEWLGEIPEHWEIKKTKYLLSEKDGIKIGPFGSALKLDTLVDEGIKVYGQGNIIKDNFEIGQRHLTHESFEENFKQYEILPGDVLVTMMGTTGRSKVFQENFKRGILDSHLLRLRFCKEVFSSELFSFLLEEGDYILHQIVLSSRGSIMAGLNSRIIKEIEILVPPLKEQIQIQEYIQRKSFFIDNILTKVKCQIKNLKDYRQSIISEAVTGKIDVREWEPTVKETV